MATSWSSSAAHESGGGAGAAAPRKLPASTVTSEPSSPITVGRVGAHSIEK